MDISGEEIRCLYDELSKDEEYSIALKITRAADKVIEELNVTSPPLQGYIEKSLQKITLNIVHAVRINTLDKTFVSPTNPDLKPKIQFLSGARMDDNDYREFIGELFTCRYSSDKLALIREKLKSFGDIEDLLLDGQLTEEEINSIFDTLGDVEIATLIRRHPLKLDIQAVDLSEAEKTLRLCLKDYIDTLPSDRQKQISEIVNQLIDD